MGLMVGIAGGVPNANADIRLGDVVNTFRFVRAPLCAKTKIRTIYFAHGKNGSKKKNDHDTCRILEGY